MWELLVGGVFPLICCYSWLWLFTVYCVKYCFRFISGIFCFLSFYIDRIYIFQMLLNDLLENQNVVPLHSLTINSYKCVTFHLLVSKSYLQFYCVFKCLSCDPKEKANPALHVPTMMLLMLVQSQWYFVTSR